MKSYREHYAAIGHRAVCDSINATGRIDPQMLVTMLFDISLANTTKIEETFFERDPKTQEIVKTRKESFTPKNAKECEMQGALHALAALINGAADKGCRMTVTYNDPAGMSSAPMRR